MLTCTRLAFRRWLPAWLLGLALVAAPGAQGLGEGIGVPPKPRPVEVGRLAFEVPSAPSFVVRGTLPLPPRTYVAGGPRTLAIVAPDGRLVPDTQIEVMTRFPSAEDGASVVELLARVKRDPAWSPGQRVSLPVVTQQGDPMTVPAIPDRHLLLQPPGTGLQVEDLLSDPNSLILVLQDPLGRSYVALPLRGRWDKEVERFGPYTTTLRTFEVLSPLGPVGPQEYPHHLAVHTYFTTFAGEELLSIDFRFSNGGDGWERSPYDDPLGKIYFHRIDLFVAERELASVGRPGGPGEPRNTAPRPRRTSWVLQQEFQDPFVYRPGDPTLKTPVSTSLSYRRFPIVEPLPDGKMHMVRCRSQFHRRLVLSHPDDQAHARDVLESAGQAFCVRGQNRHGQPYFSWWNPETAHYFPQGSLLPTLDFTSNNGSVPYYGLDHMRATLSHWLQEATQALENDTLFPSSIPEVGALKQLGWARPMGDPGGGATGGGGIQFVDGDRTAATASRDGYRFLKLRHRLGTDRQCNVLYRLDGHSAEHDQWLDPTGTYFKLPGGFSMDFGSLDQNFCGPSIPLWTQNTYVETNGLRPEYETTANKRANLLSYDAHDSQHLIRYTRIAMALAWLGNDPLAKDDIRAQTELFRMTYSEYGNMAGNSGEWTLHDDIRQVTAEPSWSFDVGRAVGWGVSAASAAYAMADDNWRARQRPWYDLIVATFDQGMARATDPTFMDETLTPHQWGVLVAKQSNKLYGRCGTCPRGRQVWEEMILSHMLRSLNRNVFEIGEPQYALVEELLHDSYYGMLAPVSWSETDRTVWFAVPVSGTTFAPNFIFDCDPTLGACMGNPLPGAFPPSGSSDHYTWSTLGNAFELTSDPVFLQRPYQALGSALPCTDCPAEIQAAIQRGSPVDPQGYSDWSMRAPLLGLAEWLNE